MKHMPRSRTLPVLELRGPVGEPLKCAKRVYASEADAVAAEKRAMRPYFCAVCDGWHMTSRLTKKRGTK